MSNPNASPSFDGENPRKAVLEAERAKWLTVEEAAFVLDIDKAVILRAIHHGQLKLFAIGKKGWRIHVDSLVQCQKAMEPPIKLKIIRKRD